MKKLIIACSLIFVSTSFVHAQAPEGFQFGGGLRLSVPIGDFSQSHSFGIGGELQGEYGFSEQVTGIFTSGYSNFFGKKENFGGFSVEYSSVGYIPILAGIRYYTGSSVFIGAQAGYGVLTGNGTSSGAFNYQPQVGYNAEKIQIAISYNGMSKEGSTISHIGLTALYKFGGGGN